MHDPSGTATATAPAGDLDSAEDRAARRRTAVKSIVGGSIGNLIEWYDFHVYTTFSIYFAASFFPRENRTIQLLSAAAIFALGFLLRPIGSWMIGLYADRRGGRRGPPLSGLPEWGGGAARWP